MNYRFRRIIPAIDTQKEFLKQPGSSKVNGTKMSSVLQTRMEFQFWLLSYMDA